MKFFADTANLEAIKEVNDLGILDGVTTNPSLMAKEGIKGEENIKKHYKAICNLVDGDISAEVISTDIEGILREARELASLADNIVVKIRHDNYSWAMEDSNVITRKETMGETPSEAVAKLWLELNKK